MKKLLTLIAFAAVLGLAAQNIPPQAINFQGVAIDKNGIPVPGMDELGNPIQNSAIRVRFSILTGSATGTVSYQEEHLTTTDEFGRFNLEIGRGTATNGTFTGINWGGDKHFLQVEVDLSALGTNYTLASVQEFLSVPYALYSKSSGSSSDDLDKDDQNEIQTLTLSGDLLSISQGNTVTLPADLDEQQLSISGGIISISNGNSISLPVDSDNQLLTVSGNDLSISNGNTVALPVSPDNQSLSISGNSLSISNGNSVTLPPNTDNQTLAISGNSVSISNGNSITLPTAPDNQTLALSGSTLSITNGNSVVLPTDADNQSLSITSSGSSRSLGITGGNSVSFKVNDADSSATNELQTLSKAGNAISLSNGGGSVLDSDNQSLSLTGNSLSISNGNSVTLPANTDNQTLAISGNSVSISNGNSITLPTAPDNQTLALSGSTLSISNGNSVVIPDAQTLSLIGTSLSISNGNTVSLPANTDSQTLTISGNSLSISNGNSVALPTSLDNDTTNELQILSLSGGVLSISSGNSVNLVVSQEVPSSSASYNCIEGGDYLDLSSLGQLFTSTTIVAINNSKAIVRCMNPSGPIYLYSLDLNTNQTTPLSIPSSFSSGWIASNDSILFLMSGTQVHAINYNSGSLINSTTIPTAFQGHYSVDLKTNNIYISGVNIVYRYSPLATIKITPSSPISDPNNIIVVGQDSILINSTLYNGADFNPIVGITYPTSSGSTTYNSNVGRLYYVHYDSNTATYELRSCNKFGQDVRTLSQTYQQGSAAYNGNVDLQPYNKCFFGDQVLLTYSGRVMPINNYFVSSATITGVLTNGFGGYKLANAEEYLTIGESRWINRLAYNFSGHNDFYMVNNKLVISFNRPYHCHNGLIKGSRGVAILN